MKKAVFLLLAVCMSLCVRGFSVMAADTYSVKVTTPVNMTYVIEREGDYEYNVKAEVTAKINDIAASTEISLLMFGNKNNNNYIAGDTVTSLTVGGVTSNYYIYYMDQGTSDINGKITFDFNVVLPSPNKDDKYYIWAGIKGSNTPFSVDDAGLSAYGDPASVTISADKLTAEQGDTITLDADVLDVFGNSIDKTGMSIEYFVKDNDKILKMGNVMDTTLLCGTYKLYSVLTKSDGTQITSNFLDITVSEKDLLGGCIIGDADGDGKITAYDAVKVLRYIVGTAALDKAHLVAANVDRNNVISITDATTILKYVARLINSF
ncbi:MAG: dockerin type I repeat-containing protein [Bacillota bacterium]|nr:dockerin type I repeat-containing protein [Bacillota bacterium]